VSGTSRQRIYRFFDQPDLALCALVAMAALVATALNLSPLLRLALAIPLVLFLPGYTLVNALFPALQLPTVERLLISLGASISLTILLGLLMAFLNVSLEGLNWAAALALITIVGSAVAWTRRARRGLPGPRPVVARMPRAGVVMIGLALLITADVVLGSRFIAGQQESPAPAQLWLVPVEGRSDDALLGIRAGASPTDYRVVISSAGEPIYDFDVPLGAGEVWERSLNFASELRRQPIVARLYEGDSTDEIRFVVLQPQTNSG
jgi:hypothetical protein